MKQRRRSGGGTRGGARRWQRHVRRGIDEHFRREPRMPGKLRRRGGRIDGETKAFRRRWERVWKKHPVHHGRRKRGGGGEGADVSTQYREQDGTREDVMAHRAGHRQRRRRR